MKEKEVIIDFKEHQLLLYAEKDDGSISPVQTGSYITKQYIDDFYEMNDRIKKALIERMKKGEISPVYFFMTIEELSVAELASRVGISKSSVRKHLNPKGFQNASVSELIKYGKVFNIPVANFFQIIETKEDKKWYIGYHEKTDRSEGVLISQVETENLIVVETKIVQDPK
jgi:transcriptional regulator with XRE-family HTH domain